MTLYGFEISDHSDLVIYTSILDSPTNYERVNSKVYKYFRPHIFYQLAKKIFYLE